MPEWAANTPWWVFAMVGLALGGAVVKVSMWAGSVNSRFDSVDSRFDSVDSRFDSVNSRFDSVDSRIDSLSDGLAEVRDGLAEVRRDIKKILERLASSSPTVQESSPVRLTGFGEKISAEVSAKAWADDHASRLTAEVAGKEDFEVFETCVAYVAERFDKDESLQRTIRAAAYEFGSDTKQVRQVYEVELRDRLLSRRSESPPPPPRA